MRISSRICFCISLVVSSQACALDKPNWLSGDADTYPHSQYLSATGSGSNAESAQDRALGNLSEIFETKIRSHTTTSEDIRIHKADGNEDVDKRQRMSREVNVRSNSILTGARIAEHWQHPQDLTFYALAVLERSQARNNLRSEMRGLDDETDNELRRAKSQRDPLLKIAALDRAMSLQVQRQGLQKTLKVIDLSGKGKQTLYSVAEIRSELENTLKSLRIGAYVFEDSLGGLDQLLLAAMGDAGFPAPSGGGDDNPSGSGEDYKLSVGLNTTDLGYREGWHWLRGKLTLKLLDSANRLRGSREWPLKVSAVQKDDAAKRMKTRVSKTLKKELRDTLINIATSSDIN